MSDYSADNVDYHGVCENHGHKAGTGRCPHCEIDRIEYLQSIIDKYQKELAEAKKFLNDLVEVKDYSEVDFVIYDAEVFLGRRK